MSRARWERMLDRFDISRDYLGGNHFLTAWRSIFGIDLPSSKLWFYGWTQSRKYSKNNSSWQISFWILHYWKEVFCWKKMPSSYSCIFTPNLSRVVKSAPGVENPIHLQSCNSVTFLLALASAKFTLQPRARLDWSVWVDVYNYSGAV